MLNPIHLRTLVEVVQLGSFAGAANRLGYTASAVSQQMAALEQASGIPLFERTARSARPTDAAKAMARRAEPLFAELDAVLDAARDAHETQSEEVSLMLYASLAHAIMPRVLTDPEFAASGIRLRLSVQDPSTTVRAISRGDASDIAFVYRYVGGFVWPSTVTHLDFGADPYRVIVPKAWSLPDRLDADALSELPWVLHQPGSSDALTIGETFRAAGVRPRVMAYCDDFGVSLDLVSSGAAAAFVPSFVVATAPDTIAVAEGEGLVLDRDVHALISPTAPGSATRTVLAAIRRALGTIPHQPAV